MSSIAPYDAKRRTDVQRFFVSAYEMSKERVVLRVPLRVIEDADPYNMVRARRAVKAFPRGKVARRSRDG